MEWGIINGYNLQKRNIYNSNTLLLKQYCQHMDCEKYKKNKNPKLFAIHNLDNYKINKKCALY